MYLDGISFTIVTDCNSLVLTLSRKLVNPGIARCALELECRIRHRRDELMPHVDTLSRIPFMSVIEQGKVDFNMQVTHSRDRTIKKIRNKL